MSHVRLGRARLSLPPDSESRECPGPAESRVVRPGCRMRPVLQLEVQRPDRDRDSDLLETNISLMCYNYVMLYSCLLLVYVLSDRTLHCHTP